MKTRNNNSNRTLLPLIMFVLMGAFLSSCTMQKRRYTKGYHVTWNVSLQSKKKRRPHQPAQVKTIETRSASEVLAISNSQTHDSILLMNTHSSDTIETKESKEDVKEKKEDNNRKENIATFPSKKVELLKNKVNNLTTYKPVEGAEDVSKTGVTMATLSVLCSPIGILLIINGFWASAGMVIAGLVLIVLGFLLGIGALDLTSKSVSRKGHGAAVVGTLIPGIIIALGLIGMLL